MLHLALVLSGLVYWLDYVKTLIHGSQMDTCISTMIHMFAGKIDARKKYRTLECLVLSSFWVRTEPCLLCLCFAKTKLNNLKFDSLVQFHFIATIKRHILLLFIYFYFSVAIFSAFILLMMILISFVNGTQTATADHFAERRNRHIPGESAVTEQHNCVHSGRGCSENHSGTKGDGQIDP